MAAYIMAENPEVGILEALNQSKLMMNGKKMDLFVLHLSFFGWFLLCIITFGIGVIFLIPYVSATTAEFYNELVGHKYIVKN
ncbi:MAG: DUF975 family protein [Oscillospiraceae bacterium]|nr:DUF975 family protein [Oscillospiraceae bacterium]